MTRLEGAVALVTGAAGGIGGAVVAALGRAGAQVVGADLSGADVDLDVTDAQAAGDAVDAVVRDHGRLDVLVTTAGIGVAGPVQDVTTDEWRRTFDVNVLGTVHVAMAAYRHMSERRHGHLALMASLAGIVVPPTMTPYASSKAAVIAFATGLRLEGAEHGVNVSVICPGPVDTRMLDDGGVAGAVRGVDVRRFLTRAAGPARSPASVAGAIVRGIERDRPVVLPGRARLLALGARAAPRTAERIVGRAHRATR